MLAEHVRDIKQKYNEFSRIGKKREDFDTLEAKFLAEELPIWFGRFEKCLSGTNGFAIGDRISLADVAIHNIIKDYFTDFAASTKAAEACPHILASVAHVEREAKVWLETRPVTED